MIRRIFGLLVLAANTEVLINSRRVVKRVFCERFCILKNKNLAAFSHTNLARVNACQVFHEKTISCLVLVP